MIKLLNSLMKEDGPYSNALGKAASCAIGMLNNVTKIYGNCHLQSQLLRLTISLVPIAY